jgi:NADH-quinone oxidoreductase subunit M
VNWHDLPWLEFAIAMPLLMVVPAHLIRSKFSGVQCAVIGSGMAFLMSAAAWAVQHFTANPDNGKLFRVDELSAPLLPIVALLHLLTAATTSRSKAERFASARFLLSLALRQAAFSTLDPNLLVPLLIACVVPPYFDLRSRGKPARVYAVHMAAFAVLLLGGWGLSAAGQREPGAVLFVLAALVRGGVLPAHVWVSDLFANGSLSSALLSVGPLVGVYAAVRLAVPDAPAWVLSVVTVLSLVTAVYSAGLAVVQTDPRRFVAHLFVSFASLVFVGLEVHTPESCTGALALWFSLMLSATGLGLVVRAVEDRYGKISLTTHHGIYERSPLLAIGFLICGLACVGFPGTVGFVTAELLIDGTLNANPWVGVSVIAVATLNGIAVMRTFWLLFTGRRVAADAPSLPLSWAERVSVIGLCVLLVAGGLYPQPELDSRIKAADVLFSVSDRTPHDAQSQHGK